MDSQRLSLLRELEQFAAENDDAAVDRSEMMFNITHDTGALLSLLVKARQATRILEIGTSNGYSTIWLGDAAASIGAYVITVEHNPKKLELARANLERTRLLETVEIVSTDAGEFLAAFEEGQFEFIFLDADRSRYTSWWPDIDRVLAPRGLLVIDNAVSHAEQLTDFRAVIDESPGFESSLIPIGKGELLVLKSGTSPDEG